MNNEKINFPEILICDSVVLERIEEFHTEDLYNTIMENKSYLKTFVHWLKDGYKLEDQEKFFELSNDNWENDIEYTYLIIDKESDKIIGAISASKKQTLDGTYDLGYWLIESSSKKGIMTQSVEELSGFILEDLGIKVSLLTETNNVASMKVALKSGFLFEGTNYDAVIEYGNILDMNKFCKFKDESKMKKLSDKQDSLKKIFDLSL